MHHRTMQTRALVFLSIAAAAAPLSVSYGCGPSVGR